MLSAERRNHILDLLQRDGRVQAADLASSLRVSEDTVRRDLRELADSGLIQRVHGGALLRSPAVGNYTARSQQASSAKVAVARAAAQLVHNGQVIVMDGGTTSLQVALHLPPDLRATIVTNSPPVAVALADHASLEIVLLGGVMYKESRVTMGAATVDALRDIRADVCLLGVCSLHPQAGISMPNIEEAYVKRAMIAGAGEVIALATAEKLGTAVPYVVGPITDLTHIVTEHSVPDDILQPYRAQGVTIVLG